MNPKIPILPGPAETSPGNGDKLPLINTRDGFAIPQESIE
jgi:hypothetical protein